MTLRGVDACVVARGPLPTNKGIGMESSQRAIRLLLIDADPIVRSFLHDNLNPEDGLDVVGYSVDASDATLAAQRLRPDLILIEPKGWSTERLVSFIVASTDNRQASDATRLLLWTALAAEDSRVLAALSAGASGYVHKSSLTLVLAASARAAFLGEVVLPPSLLATLLHADDKRSDLLTLLHSSLSGREIAVLRLLTQGLSNREIAANLGVAETTIKSHVSHLLTRLSLRDRTQAVVFAFRNGLADPRDKPHATATKDLSQI